MKLTLGILLILLIGCTNENTSTKSNRFNLNHSQPIENNKHSFIQKEFDFYNSLENAFVDTTTLKGKQEYIHNQFLIMNSPSGSEYDTLFDINYDGKKDYVIGYYGLAGTGLKNRIDVYLFNKKFGGYQYDSLLSNQTNPSIYLKEKIITSFYIGYGGGECFELRWIENRWKVYKKISVSNQEENSIWYVKYPLSGKEEKIHYRYEMEPPNWILKNKYAD